MNIQIDKNSLASVANTLKNRSPDNLTPFLVGNKVSDMSAVFFPAPFNGDIRGWNTANVSEFEAKALQAAKEVEMELPATPFDVDMSKWELKMSKESLDKVAEQLKNTAKSVEGISTSQQALASEEHKSNWDVSKAVDLLDALDTLFPPPSAALLNKWNVNHPDFGLDIPDSPNP